MLPALDRLTFEGSRPKAAVISGAGTVIIASNPTNNSPINTLFLYPYYPTGYYLDIMIRLV